MTMLPLYYDLFLSYFQATEHPTLADYVNKHAHIIAAYHSKGDDITRVWSSRYGIALAYHYADIPKSERPAIKPKDVDWGKVALLILEAESIQPTSVELSPATPNSATTSASARSSNSSNSSASILTAGFLDEFRAHFTNMTPSSKWKLSTGTVVEDKLFGFGLTRKREHAAHSFIIDVNDPVWTETFTSSELKEISQFRPHPLPPAPDALLEYLNSFTTLDNIKDLSARVRMETFDYDTQFDLDWAQMSIDSALRMLKCKYLPLSR